METSDFGKGVKKLAAVFGENNFPEAKTKIIFEKLKNWPATFFWEAVDRIIVSESKPPNLDRIFEELRLVQIKYDNSRFSSGPVLPPPHPRSAEFASEIRNIIIKSAISNFPYDEGDRRK